MFHLEFDAGGGWRVKKKKVKSFELCPRVVEILDVLFLLSRFPCVVVDNLHDMAR